MNNWLPVIATLSGAIVAGLISLFLHWLANKHSAQHTRLVLAEERARWATERRLADLKDFFGAIEKLMEATQQFRIQQAWAAVEEKEGTKPHSWVPSYNDARGGFENALHAAVLHSFLLEAEVEADFRDAKIIEIDWLVAKTADDAVLALCAVEQNIDKFRRRISKRYQSVFDERRKGLDIDK
jgi:hypothetical protein